MDELNNYKVCKRCGVLINTADTINPVKFSYGKPTNYDGLYSRVCQYIEKKGNIVDCILLDANTDNNINHSPQYDPNKDYPNITLELDHMAIAKELNPQESCHET